MKKIKKLGDIEFNPNGPDRHHGSVWSKVNEIIDHLNHQPEQQLVDQLERKMQARIVAKHQEIFGKQQRSKPKWEEGETAYYIHIETSDVYDWSIVDTEAWSVNEDDLNLFKTKEEAQQCLDEIIEVMKKYQ